MADRILERSFEQACVEAEAALARDEELAADDLAHSLIQGASLAEALKRWRSTEVLCLGVWGRVSRKGPDHVVLGDGATLVPHRAIAAARSTSGAMSGVTDLSLLERLRGWARASTEVGVRTSQVNFRGRLNSAAPDHLVLAGPEGEILIPLTAVASVTTLGGGSTVA
jgi:hypothetical protein